MLPKLSPGVSLGELAQSIQGHIHGNGDVQLTGVASLEQAERGDLGFVTNPALSSLARQSHASAFVISQPLEGEPRPQLITPNPLYAFACLTQRYFLPPPSRQGIAETVVKGSDVRIGPDTSIGAFVTLGDRVQLGACVTVYPGVVLGQDVVIGDDSILYPNVTVLEGCQIGARVIVHCGTVIGSDGFGYVEHQGRHQKIPQLGSVLIEDDVELGANVTVDRATFGYTIVKRGTKIDNQVQIAHNVQIGEDCILVAQVGIAGSTTVGHHVLIGGQAGLTDHLTIGDQAKIAAGSGVSRSVEAGKAVGGSMAFDYTSWLKAQALLQRLPEMRKEILELKARLADLESKP